MSTMAEGRGVPFVAPHGMRANQGNPSITAWCPKCEERVVPMRNGTCGFCDTAVEQIPAEPPTPAEVLGAAGDAVDHDGREPSIAERIADREERGLTTPGLPPLPVRAAPTLEQREVVHWRRLDVLDWIREQGTATMVEVGEHFDLDKQTVRRDVEALRIAGKIERTGHSRTGSAGGRASPEFRAVELDETSHARTSPGEAEPESRPDPGPGDAADDDRTIAEGHHDEQRAPAAAGREAAAPTMTEHQRLTIRYLDCLIGWIERSSITRDQGPPEHVYERIERMLGIQDGVA